MKREEILKRDDGTSVKIDVMLNIDSRDVYWKVWVGTRKKGHKIFKNVVDYDSYEYRKVEFSKRAEYENSKFYLHVTPQEIYNAKRKLIESIPV